MLVICSDGTYREVATDMARSSLACLDSKEIFVVGASYKTLKCDDSMFIFCDLLLR